MYLVRLHEPNILKKPHVKLKSNIYYCKYNFLNTHLGMHLQTMCNIYKKLNKVKIKMISKMYILDCSTELQVTSAPKHRSIIRVEWNLTVNLSNKSQEAVFCADFRTGKGSC